jgi:DNA-nicking Smr family endonuclease
LRPEEQYLWARVAATIHPAPGRHAPMPALANLDSVAPPAPASPKKPRPGPQPSASSTPPAPPRQRQGSEAAPELIEKGRLRRLTRERDPLGPRLDLHGLDQDKARAQLIGFIHRAHQEGWRAVLVITGKGSRGDGVLRRMTPEWLAAPALRDLVAGVSEAHRRHGGQGALYVALKRRAKA